MISLNKNAAVAKTHYDTIKQHLQQRIQSILARGIRVNGVKYNPDRQLITYLNYLEEESNLSQLILTPPESIPGLISSITRNYPNFIRKNNPSNRILYNLFVSHCYDKLDRFNKLDFIKNLDIHTCPYCNRNYIYYICERGTIKPQIDHFYPKSKFPFLAMSFYNLIPSCQTCNGFEAKGDKDPIREGLINPYLLNQNDFCFNYEPTSLNFINSFLDKNSIKVKIGKNISGHISVFKLAELYEHHADHVLELIIKSKIKYSETYRGYLQSYQENGLKFSNNEVDRMILGNYSNIEEMHKRPLAKLYQDIGKELGIIPK